MDQSEITERLFLLARTRLKNRPGDFMRFQFWLKNTAYGMTILHAPESLMPASAFFGEWGANTEAIDRFLIKIIDVWAEKHPFQHPSVDPLPLPESTVPLNCRVTRSAVHALADEYADVQAAAPSEAESKDADETLGDDSMVFKKTAMVKELIGIWPTIVNDLGEASREKGGLKGANVRHSYWNVGACIRWAVAHGKIVNNQATKNYVTDKDDSPFAVLLKTMFKI